MIRARVTLAQRIKKTVEVEADSYYDLYQIAKCDLGSCMLDGYTDYDSYDDYDEIAIEVIEEWDEESEDEE